VNQSVASFKDFNSSMLLNQSSLFLKKGASKHHPTKSQVENITIDLTSTISSTQM